MQCPESAAFKRLAGTHSRDDATRRAAATGRLPFYGRSMAEFFVSILKSKPVPPSHLNSEIPKELERTILNCLEKDLTLRYQSASGVLADLKRVQRDLVASSSGRGVVSAQEETALKKRRFAGSRVGVATGLAAVVGVTAIVGSVWLMKGRAGQTGSPEQFEASHKPERRLSTKSWELHGTIQGTRHKTGAHTIRHLCDGRAFEEPSEIRHGAHHARRMQEIAAKTTWRHICAASADRRTKPP